MSDASPIGIGICLRDRDIDDVAEVGRFSERWRFRLLSSIQARKSALGCDEPYSKIVSEHGPFLEKEVQQFEEVPKS
eukprot:12398313-Karenia_brevis.AAC.1